MSRRHSWIVLGFQQSKVSCFPYILACVIYLCCYKNILCACAFYPLVFLTITLSHKARIPGKTNRIRNMAEAHPTDKVRTICSIVGLPNSGPITAVISTIIVPEVRIYEGRWESCKSNSKTL